MLWLAVTAAALAGIPLFLWALKRDRCRLATAIPIVHGLLIPPTVALLRGSPVEYGTALLALLLALAVELFTLSPPEPVTLRP
ncbi:MAG: hypothetical protein QXQ60_09210 [Thermofilum sp.]